MTAPRLEASLAGTWQGMMQSWGCGRSAGRRRDLPAACGSLQVQGHMDRYQWSCLKGKCQGPGNVLSSGSLCLAFGRAEAGSVVPWEVCTCVLCALLHV